MQLEENGSVEQLTPGKPLPTALPLDVKGGNRDFTF